MDALALLCTLHADGPATWRRLRETGCRSLADLARFEPEELSEILGGTPAAARRFLREARHLGERSGGQWLEREDAPAAALSASAAGELAPAARVELPARDQQIVDRVLRAWREEDTKEFGVPEPAVVVPAPEPPPPLLAGAQLPITYEIEPSPAPQGHALEPELLDGFSERVCEQLHAEGVHTLEQLLEADLGQLALHSGLGYSRLYRWRSLAERELRAQGTREAESQTESQVESQSERLSPAEIPMPVIPRDLLQIPLRNIDLPRRAPRWAPLEEGAAGPFA
jgi:hypothetical protein